MLDYSTLNKYDSEKIFQIYDRWAIIAKESYHSDLTPVDFENIDHIVFAGMGGSGAIGDLFASILSKSNIHVNVVKGYLLPKTVDENTLVVTISISGNSIETLLQRLLVPSHPSRFMAPTMPISASSIS